MENWVQKRARLLEEAEASGARADERLLAANYASAAAEEYVVVLRSLRATYYAMRAEYIHLSASDQVRHWAASHGGFFRVNIASTVLALLGLYSNKQQAGHTLTPAVRRLVPRELKKVSRGVYYQEPQFPTSSTY